MKRAIHFLDINLEKIMLVVSTIAMIILIFLQVISRRFLNISLAWSEELSRYIFVWSVWMAVPYAVIKGRHIRLTFLRDALNDTGKFVLDMCFFVISIGFFAYIGFSSISLVSQIKQMGQLTPALAIPKWLCYLSLPAGCLLGSLRFAQYGIIRIKRFINNPEDNRTFAISDDENEV